MPSVTSELGVLLLADARLPTGGHTQSAGLEPALLGGMPDADVPTYLTTRLRTSTLVDAATAVVALHHLDTGLDTQPVVDAWAARTPSDVVRTASTEVGRGYSRLLAHLAPSSPSSPTRPPSKVPDIPQRPTHNPVGVRSPGLPGGVAGRVVPRPVAVAALAQHLGIGPADLARLVCHDDVQSVCAAALKLTPLDPTVTVAWALSCAEEIEAVVRRVAGLTDPEDIPAASAPALELWQHAHSHAPRRLFRA